MKPGWETERLGAVCELISGQHIDAKDYNEDRKGVAYLTGPSDFGERTPIVTKWTEFPKRMACPGDILITVKGSGVGKINFLDAEVAISRQLMAIRPHSINTEFLYAFLWTHFDHFQARSTGAAIPGISREDVLSLKCPVPPPAEQQRIVAILDEAFEGITTAKANAEKNLQNAREVFKSQLNYTFAQSDPKWDRVKIDDACESIMDCVNKTAPKVDGPTPFKMIRTTNVRNGCVNLDSVNYVTEDVYRIWTRRQIPQPGDVILTREAPMGEVGILENEDQVFLGQRLVSYRANPAKLNNRFLLYAFQSSNLQGQINALASGSTVQHMRVPDSKNLLIPLPGLTIQQETAMVLDSICEDTKRLESIYQQKLTSLNELKQSLLHRAFNGDL